MERLAIYINLTEPLIIRGGIFMKKFFKKTIVAVLVATMAMTAITPVFASDINSPISEAEKDVFREEMNEKYGVEIIKVTDEWREQYNVEKDSSADPIGAEEYKLRVELLAVKGAIAKLDETSVLSIENHKVLNALLERHEEVLAELTEKYPIQNETVQNETVPNIIPMANERVLFKSTTLVNFSTLVEYETVSSIKFFKSVKDIAVGLVTHGQEDLYSSWLNTNEPYGIISPYKAELTVTAYGGILDNRTDDFLPVAPQSVTYYNYEL